MLYRASLDSRGHITDKQRGLFIGPSQWAAAVMNKSVAAASKLAWKSVLYKGESLAYYQQQFATLKGIVKKGLIYFTKLLTVRHFHIIDLLATVNCNLLE